MQLGRSSAAPRPKAAARAAPAPAPRVVDVPGLTISAGRGRGGARAEVREDQVDHRRLGDERDEAHRAVAGGTRERVDLEDLLQEGGPA